MGLLEKYNAAIHSTNDAIARSIVGKRFRLDGSGHVRTARCLCDEQRC